VAQETRLWDPASDMTVPMRSKEESHDYRYFPEPDLVPVYINQEWIEKVQRTLPELPDAKMYRLVEEWGIPLYDASVLTSSSSATATYFEEAVAIFDKPKVVSNWIMGEILRKLKDTDCSIEDCPVTPNLLVELLTMIDLGEISGKIAKVVFDEMYDAGGQDPHKIVEEKGLTQIKDESALENVVEEVLCENPDAIKSYKEGKQKLFGFLVGQVMKKTQGKANPQLVNKLLHQRLDAA
jgi:aspartyl-tRNA(Asn)/glutamyl-tRNA(Gln) amidotransferase subunit B